ncbi:MAG: hypothetical protein WD341_08800 [Tistlia sp.]|uniref:hypothetical protein n=1 Tax=Tistlia sp. TaxID=3057121 RepID=UPI0034A422AC
MAKTPESETQPVAEVAETTPAAEPAKKASSKGRASEPDLAAAALKLVSSPVRVTRRGKGGKLEATTRQAKPADLLAVNLVGDELVVVTVDGQRFRGRAPK